MKKVLLIIALMTTILYPQLKELVIKPTENRGGIPIFRDYPDKMAVFFYSSFDNLKIVSSYGIDKIYERGGGVYIVIITPERQRLEVQCAGYKTEVIHIKEGAARDCLFYTVDPKKDTDEVKGVKELAITIQATPADAKITIDGKEVKNNTATFFTLGSHTLKVEKTGSADYIKEIEVSTANTLFQVTLKTIDPVKLTIDSNPQEADIYIDGSNKGKTRKALFMFPGVFELRLVLSGYLALSEKITVYADEARNNYNLTLIKNTGKLKIDITPVNATVRINREIVSAKNELELPPGTYQIEAEANSYIPYKNTIIIELGKSVNEKIALTQKVGKLQFAINPPEAECSLTQNGVEKYSWTGFKIFNSIAEGSYELSAKASEFKTIRKNIEITENQTIVEDIQMEKGSSRSIDKMVFVEGGSFTMGSYDYPDETPHRVTVNSFYISKYEVTVGEYRAFCRATGREAPPRDLEDEYPVSNISWFDAVGYCRWAGVRLPTEAEWQYAARGGKNSRGFKYSGSNNLYEVGWFNANSYGYFHKVGSKLPNELGIYDMSGNVFEWCSDWYGEFYFRESSNYNPMGPSSGEGRVLCGGSWSDTPEYCRVAARIGIYPSSSELKPHGLGFRVAKD